MSGMGDQIKRYCEKLEPEEYEELLDNEVILLDIWCLKIIEI